MQDTLYIGDYAYSSWSLRGWLLMERFGIGFRPVLVDFARAEVAEQMPEAFPAKTVPTLVTTDGAVIWDSLAMAEELASRHPQAGIWPKDASLRALSRSLAAEMHSGFAALRDHCPMNLRCAYRDVPVPEAVDRDLRRIELIWTHALTQSGGPWLCGTYSAADAFYAPVAARIAGYGLQVSEQAQDYVAAHLADPAFRRWRAMGLVHGQDLPWYAKSWPQKAWPGPDPVAAHAVDVSPSENDLCPYSGKPVSHFLETSGRVFGFCNPFCRDKTAADPEAWPAFVAMRDGVARG